MLNRSCKRDKCPLPAERYVELKKTRMGFTSWLSGHFCEEDANRFIEVNAYEGYEVHKDISEKEYQETYG